MNLNTYKYRASDIFQLPGLFGQTQIIRKFTYRKRGKMFSKIDMKQSKSKPSKIKRAKKVKDYGNDPFFIRKGEESSAFLEKHGFPKELVTKK
jgi:hypothetical protein